MDGDEYSAGPLIIRFVDRQEDEYGRDISEEREIKISTITNASQSIQKMVTSTPIPSKGTEATFSVEGGSTMTYTFTFLRNNPVLSDDGDIDSDSWSNYKWYLELTRLIDRWQMKTDGCKITYNVKYDIQNVPDSDDVIINEVPCNPNAIFVNGKRVYVKTLTRKYSSDFNTVISGSITFVVGGRNAPSASSVITRDIPSYILCHMKPGNLGSYQAIAISANEGDTINSIFNLTDEFRMVEVKIGYEVVQRVVDNETVNVLKFTGKLTFTVPFLPSLWKMCEDYVQVHPFTNWIGIVEGANTTSRASMDLTPGTKDVTIQLILDHDEGEQGAEDLRAALKNMALVLTANWVETEAS